MNKFIPVDEVVSHDVSDAVFRSIHPIRTHYIGTIAFQGTDEEIAQMIRKTFGGKA